MSTAQLSDARDGLGTVIAATDFSESGRRAIERALRLPMASGARLTLLHVVPPREASGAARAEAAAAAALAGIVDSSRAALPPGVTISAAVSTGEPFAEIARRADAEGAELIVVGKRNEHGWRRRLLGSTVERLLRVTRVGVLVVAANARDAYRRPLVAIDDEGCALTALRLLAHVLTPDVHHGVALHVLDKCTPESAPAVYSRGNAQVAQLRDASEKSACAIIRPELTGLCGGEFEYELRCVAGQPVSAILEEARAEHADVVAVGTHGRAGIDRLLAGSVAAGVIERNDADTLVARTVSR